MIKLSIAGADDMVNINELLELINKYPLLEIGILLTKKDGRKRYPKKEWRDNCYNSIKKENLAIHLCGEDVFCEILSDDFQDSELLEELKKVSRVQLNINPFKKVFKEKQIYEIYDKLNKNNLKLIYQYHEDSEIYIMNYLNKSKEKNADILMDSSKGKGVVPKEFIVPEDLEKRNDYLGFAGGLNVENIKEIYDLLKNKVVKNNFWLDLESGARTDNELDIKKVDNLCKIIFNK